MKVFTTTCIDSITGNEMIASECSFNGACSLLERRFPELTLIGVRSENGNMVFEYRERTFVYDELRGYLMGVC